MFAKCFQFKKRILPCFDVMGFLLNKDGGSLVSFRPLINISDGSNQTFNNR